MMTLRKWVVPAVMLWLLLLTGMCAMTPERVYGREQAQENRVNNTVDSDENNKAENNSGENNNEENDNRENNNAENDNGENNNQAKDNPEEDADDYLDAIVGKLNLTEVDSFTEKKLPERYQFSDMVHDLIDDYGTSGTGKGSQTEWLGHIGKYILDLFFYEMSVSKPLFVEMILLAILFAVTNRVSMTCSKYVSNMSFLVVYGAMMILLMQSFLLVNEVLQEGLNAVMEFLRVVVPAYATTLMLSGNAASAGIFYEMTFALVLIIESAMKYVLVPAIHIFVLLEFLDHLFEEEKLSKLAELIESGVGVALKLAFGSVIGISTVQSLLTTAKDRVSGNVVLKSISMLPGIGNTLGSTGEIVLGCGILVKNSIGIAAVLILLFLCLMPIVKIFAFTFLYRFVVALLQPVADKRIVECIQGVARGSTMYLKLMVDTMLLFMIVISMITASTSFIF